MMRLLAILLMTALAAGCAARGSASSTSLKRKAAFDLNCDPQNVTIFKLDTKTRGVMGCSAQAVYIEVCEHQNDMLARSCSWRANAQRRLPAGYSAEHVPDAPVGSGKLERRASFDLLCPVQQLTTYHLGPRSTGVRGCGQKAIYQERCEDQNDVALAYCSYFMESHQLADPVAPPVP